MSSNRFFMALLYFIHGDRFAIGRFVEDLGFNTLLQFVHNFSSNLVGVTLWVPKL